MEFKPVGSTGFFFAGFQNEKEGVAHASYLAITSLAASKSVAIFTLREEGTGEKLLRCFMENLPRSQDPRGNERPSIIGPDPLLTPSLAGLVNYARASENFRQLIRGADDLLPSLQLLFLDEVVKKIPSHAFVNAQEKVARLLLALVLHKDSQEWAIGTGYLGLLASIFQRASRTQADQISGGAVMTCLVVLLRLCGALHLVDTLKGAGMPSLLEPYASLLNSHCPGLWEELLATLARRPSKIPYVSEISRKAVWKHAKAKLLGLPTVCSWEGCSKTADDDQGTSCNSKEHQKLHWRTHKKHCLPENAAPSQAQ
ncbi:hypothetical protein KFL_002910170 [Klebsormidium nitens]|uniref:MYND-type domain-containing protein n=1 Tax=Klebsormidium nitens TaxID=105231 RepID=A0A1Y1IAM3_KLENI|nr:hypothetical protein KFL_002910170 [Klebsormidium nitens]|eukprot:GAQ86479.1 hypothetical protein KFL_002910170 [Klebsormidium nitens]